MDREQLAAVFKRMPVTRRQWGIFVLRWLIPVGLLTFAFLGPATLADSMIIPIVLVSTAAILTNLLVALLLVLEYWAPFVTVLIIVADIVLAGAAIYFTDVRLLWLGLLPLIVLGMTVANWIVSLGAGVVAAGALLAMQILLVEHSMLTIPLLLELLIIYPGVGPLAYLLAGGEPLSDRPHTPAPARRRQRAAAATTASEYLTIIGEMAEVLSASRLDPTRVLGAAVGFGLDGLERAGVKPPLFGAILLFDVAGPGQEPVLRVAQASSLVKPADRDMLVPGVEGAIGQAISRAQPARSDSPADDPELSRYETFQQCATVLCLPLVSGQDAFGVYLVGSMEPGAFKDVHIEMMNTLTHQTAASMNNARLYVSLKEQRDRIVGVEKAARAQLAAELHDGPTQGVSAVTMRLNYARRLLDKKPGEALEELYQIEELARSTTKEIRAMLFTLRPKALDRGLAAGLEQLAIQMKETYDQAVEVNVAPQADQRLDDQSTQTLFSVVTEAVNNARKHADASLIRVTVEVQGDSLVTQIEDNGNGFDVDATLARAQEREGHLGLINLQERAALMEGTLSIDSTPGEGTRMTIRVPLEVLRQRQADERQREVE